MVRVRGRDGRGGERQRKTEGERKRERERQTQSERIGYKCCTRETDTDIHVFPKKKENERPWMERDGLPAVPGPALLGTASAVMINLAVGEINQRENIIKKKWITHQ